MEITFFWGSSNYCKITPRKDVATLRRPGESLLQGEFKIILGTQSKTRHRQEALRAPFQNHPILTRWVLWSPESTFLLGGTQVPHSCQVPAMVTYWARHFNIPGLRLLICKMEMKTS